MKSKIIMFIIIITTLCIGIGCSKESINIDNKDDNKANKNIQPISKANVINVLKSEYGDMVINTENDIKQEDENYIVDVYIEPTADEEEHNESQEHDHKKSIGIHKINIYTGELNKPETNE